MENFHALRSAGFTRVMYILPRRYTYCTTFLCPRQQVFTFVTFAILRVHLFVILKEHLFVILREERPKDLALDFQSDYNIVIQGETFRAAQGDGLLPARVYRTQEFLALLFTPKQRNHQPGQLDISKTRQAGNR